MSNRRIQLNSVLLVLLCLVLLCSISVLAVGSCSLHVVIQNEGGDSVPNINVELFCVALEQSGGTYAYTSDYSALDIPAQTLAESPNAENTEKVVQYTHASELDGITKRTPATGKADFTSLEKGVYLVLDRGDQAVAFQPYLVVLPTEIDGILHTDVTSIPKTSDTDTKAFMVVKLWEDDMDAAGHRPGSIEVTVLRNGTPIRSVILNESNSWQHMFYMLPEVGTYTVKETAVAGYETEYLPAAEGYVIINTYTGAPGPSEPPTAHVVVRKVWSDSDNAAGKRPASITVQLIEGSTVIQTAALSSANSWTHTFTGLDPAKSYTAKEIIPANYSAAYSGTAATGIVITNTFAGTTDPGTPPPPVIPTPKTINIPVKVVWEDLDNADGKRPNEVTVRLISDGNVIQTLTLTAASDWTGLFADVAADLPYTIWQNSVTDYSTAYSGNAAEGFVVTNTYTAGTTDPGLPPAPSTPSDPTDPSEPSVPVGPADPIEPTEPSEPAEPSDPTDPSQPVEDPKPVQPTIPQTGTVLLPVYLLMAVGALLTVLGVADILRRRRES